MYLKTGVTPISFGEMYVVLRIRVQRRLFVPPLSFVGLISVLSTLNP